MATDERLILRGPNAYKFLPFARRKAESLLREAKLAGIGYLTRHYRMPGSSDASVVVRILDSIKHIRITTGGCPEFLSGLVHITNPLIPNKLISGVAGSGTEVYGLDRYYPSPEYEDERRWIVEPGLNKVGASFRDAKASMYSAEMRKVVQILQGENVVPPYSPTFAVTHGVFTGSKDEKWIIEISSEGVVAWKMKICTDSSKSPEEQNSKLGYVPLASPKPSGEALDVAILNGSYRVLTSSGNVQDFYTKTAFFPNCGWAFNSDGHEAINVCYNFPDTWMRTYLFEIIISEQDGAPSQAALSEVESSYLHGEKNSTHMKYPSGDQLFSFDVDYGVLPHPPGAQVAPVFCYFDTDDTREIVYFQFDPTTTSIDDTGNLPKCVSWLIDGATFADRTGAENGRAHFNVIGDPLVEVTTRLEIAYGTYVFKGYNILVTTAASRPFGIRDTWTEWGQISAVLRQYTYFRGGRSIVIVPAYDREAYYYATTSTLEEDETSRVESTNPVTNKQPYWWAKPVEYCDISLGGPIWFELTSVVVNERFTCVQGGFGTTGDRIPDFELGEPVAIFSPNAGYFPGMIPGEVFKLQDQTTDPLVQCPPLAEGVAYFKKTEFPPPQSTSTVTELFHYRASGGVQLAIPQPAASHHWFDKIQFSTQTLYSVRDAFEGGRYIIFKDINDFGGANYLTGLMGEYPVASIGSSYAFTGEP